MTPPCFVSIFHWSSAFMTFKYHEASVRSVIPFPATVFQVVWSCAVAILCWFSEANAMKPFLTLFSRGDEE